MKKDSEDLLREAMSRIQKKADSEALASMAKGDEENNKIAKSNSDYRNFVQPIEFKILQERLPSSFLKVFGSFKTQIERKLGGRVDETAIFKWSDVGPVYAYDDPLKHDNFYNDEAAKNRGKVLELVKTGTLDLTSAVYKKIYYGNSSSQAGMRHQDLYTFGYESNAEGLSWNVGHTGIYTETKDLQTLASSMADIIVNNKINKLIYRSGRTPSENSGGDMVW